MKWVGVGDTDVQFGTMLYSQVAPDLDVRGALA